MQAAAVTAKSRNEAAFQPLRHKPLLSTTGLKKIHGAQFPTVSSLNKTVSASFWNIDSFIVSQSLNSRRRELMVDSPEAIFGYR